MKLVALANQYRILNDTMHVVEETTRLLKNLKPDYVELAQQMHSGLEKKLNQKLPAPKNIGSNMDYTRYYDVLVAAVKPHYNQLISKEIRKGDRVRVVKPVKRNGRDLNIQLNSEWTVLKKTAAYYVFSSERQYLLDTKRAIGRNTRFRRVEIEKVTDSIPPTLEEFVSGFCVSDSAKNVVECIKGQMAKTTAPAVQKCIYNLGIGMFPEYRSTLRKAFPEMQ